MQVTAFIARWADSGAAERANKDAFLIDLCSVLGVPPPDPATGDAERDHYIFERDALLPVAGGRVSIGKIDLYKKDCFVLEAKQGSEAGARKTGTARRDTPAWQIAMRDAFGQALGYARTFDPPPPFVVTCDIGYCFDLYAAFDRTIDYRPFPNPQASRLYLKDLDRHVPTLRSVFLDPRQLDPARRSAEVTREVAAHLAELAKALEQAGHRAEAVATFLMRCLFTMFAEDVGLLPERIFTNTLEKEWLRAPGQFAAGAEALWRAMNSGWEFGFAGKLLRFNGGLFASTSAIALDKPQLELLLAAARCQWSHVEPAIFGTLLERALDPRERHSLGAHYTPRAYVERLVRKTIEDPLRAEWAMVQAEARQLVAADKLDSARKAVRDFHARLCDTRVLDPACGSGNFLYVTLDLFKRLEAEVLALLSDLGDRQTLLDVNRVQVDPAQFHGIEVKRWAKEITELVLWIGYLQWHFRTRSSVPPREPVLHAYGNVECRDAVLAYDREEPRRDPETGRPVSRWDGFTFKPNPVTGEAMPDEDAQVPVFDYVNPRAAEWPEVDYVVGNPPFVGNKRMRAALGDGYADALRAVHGDVPETSDYVMYWWNHAARLARSGKIRRFGLITTNSIGHSQGRKVVEQHLEAKDPLSLVFAVPDHPWVDSADGAAVRIAMTVGAAGTRDGELATVVEERETGDGEVTVRLEVLRGTIHPDLSVGPAVSRAVSLRANQGLSFMGVTLVGDGFRLTPAEVGALGYDVGALPGVLRPYRNGRDLAQKSQGRYVIDFFGLSEEEARNQHPRLFQWVLDRVKPERATNKRAAYRDRWWLFGEPRAGMRRAFMGLPRYLATLETSKHRYFTFFPAAELPDHSLFAIASDDAFVLGVLSSRVHLTWAASAGSTLEDRPRWRNVTCFEPFPFPDCSDAARSRIRELAEDLDAHRKARQAEHPELTLTAIYNVLEKLRAGSALAKKDKTVHEEGLVSTLRKLHDDLDAAVLAAYAWPLEASEEDLLGRLVALNTARAAEEARGVVRWIRPDYQRRDEAPEVQQQELPEEEAGASAAAMLAAAQPWPRKLSERVAATRTLLSSVPEARDLDTVAAAFKGARRADIEAVLDSLTALGLAVRYMDAGRLVWRSA